ncbi:MAG: MBL fold metallo-hydrolase [Myxococcota bacterium]|jgi:phosphoribosyl 1,2-cyclic phosphodiesterase|nr:MBL fold metallo-hydrolase [Myxococcota bacterium]
MAQGRGQFIVRFWGVRGSIPTPGPDTVRYGGNTTCIEVRCDDQVIVIDTGTGARRLGTKLLAEAYGDLSLVLFYSHLHMDHIQGFPFFAPIYEPTTNVHIYSGPPAESTTRGVLTTQMADPSFPVPLSHLRSSLNFHNIERGDSVKIGSVEVQTCELNHPGRAMAIRVNHRGKSFVQCSDVEHQGPEPDADLVELCREATYLSYDSTYVEGPEFDAHIGWGHSTWQHGVKVADAAEVETFIAFHHDPGHNDAFMDRLAESLARARRGSLVAREGMTLDLLEGTVSYNDPNRVPDAHI